MCPKKQCTGESRWPLFQRNRELSFRFSWGTITVARPSPKGACLKRGRNNQASNYAAGKIISVHYLALHTGTAVLRILVGFPVPPSSKNFTVQSCPLVTNWFGVAGLLLQSNESMFEPGWAVT